MTSLKIKSPLPLTTASLHPVLNAGSTPKTVRFLMVELIRVAINFH